MTDTKVSPEDVKHRVKLGPLNRWWPVAANWMVTDTPLGLTRLGEQIAIWRDTDQAARWGDRVHRDIVQHACGNSKKHKLPDYS